MRLALKCHLQFSCEGKMNAFYLRSDKTAILGTIKAHLPFSEGQISAVKFVGQNSVP